MRRGWTVFAALAALMLAGCVRTAQVPMPTLALPGNVVSLAAAAAPPESRCLVVLLPGRWDDMGDFADAGFHEAVQERGLDVDLLAADAHMGYYRERSFDRRLLADVLEPAQRRGYEHIWLAGTSLGGLGAILMARDHAADLAGIVLLAPFVGEEQVIAEITSAGGVRRWTPAGPVAPDDFQRELWMLLRQWAGRLPPLPVWLGAGVDDSFAPSHRLFATVLPPERVVFVPGGHDWETWARLWRRFLATGDLDRCGASARAAVGAD